MYQLDINPPKDGDYRIISTPQGIDCSSPQGDCSSQWQGLNGLPPNDVPTIQISVATGETSTFDGWDDPQRVIKPGSCQTFERSWGEFFNELFGGDPRWKTIHRCDLNFTNLWPNKNSLIQATLTPKLLTTRLTVKKEGSGSGTVTGADVQLTGTIDCGSECSDLFRPATLVVLTAKADDGSQFIGWSDPSCGAKLICTLTMDRTKEITARFNKLEVRNLSITRQGTGVGSVTSAPARIDCGTTCLAKFPLGSRVTLTAAAYPNNTFGGWSGSCWGDGPTCSVYIYSATDVTATFNLSRFRLFVLKIGSGTGTVVGDGGVNCGSNCLVEYNANTVVNLSANPTNGAAFAGWGGDCTGLGPCAVTMDSAKRVTATFNPPSRLTITKEGKGTGTVKSVAGQSVAGTSIDCGNKCSELYAANTVVSLVATPSSGAAFAGWGGDCTGVGPCAVTMDSAKRVTATFNPPSRLTIIKMGTGTGTVVGNGGIKCGSNCSVLYNANTLVNLRATPTNGATFAGWGWACEGVGPCAVTTDSEKIVTATFRPPQTNLTINKDGMGTGTVSGTGISCGTDCSESYDRYTMVELSANPSPGSSFEGWTPRDICPGKGSCLVWMDKAYNVRATFNLTSTCVANGAIKSSSTPCCPGTLECPDSTCRSQCPSCGGQGSTPNRGVGCCYGLTKCSDNICRKTCTPLCTGEGARPPSGSSCCQNLTLCTNGTCQRSCAVQTSYQLTVGRQGQGSGTITGNGIKCGSVCTTSLPSGTVVTLSASAAAGSTFGRWSSSCQSQSQCSFTLTGNTSMTATFDQSLCVQNGGNGTGACCSGTSRCADGYCRNTCLATCQPLGSTMPGECCAPLVRCPNNPACVEQCSSNPCPTGMIRCPNGTCGATCSGNSGRPGF